MHEKGIPFQLYRDLLELSELCDDMREGGIRVDVSYIRNLEGEFQKRKEELFPFEVHGKERIFSKFNPQSPEQIVEYFSTHGIYLILMLKKNIGDWHSDNGRFVDSSFISFIYDKWNTYFAIRQMILYGSHQSMTARLIVRNPK